jgi:hypothetical protein
MSTVTFAQLVKYIKSADNNDSSEIITIKQDDFVPLNINSMKIVVNLPEPFKSIIDLEPNNSIKRYGVLESYREGDNNYTLSLFSSIMLCIDQSIISADKKNQFYSCKQMIEKILLDYSQQNLFSKYSYFSKYKWKKQELYQQIKSFQSNNNVMMFLTDYFCVNIFIFDLKTSKIIAIYPTDEFCKFRKIIILIGHLNGSFEPLVKNEDYFWTYRDSVIKAITTSPSFTNLIIRPQMKPLINEPEFTVGTENLLSYLMHTEQDKKIKNKNDTEIIPESHSDFSELFSNLKLKKNTYEEDDSESIKYFSDKDDHQETEYEEESLKKDDMTDIFYKANLTDTSLSAPILNKNKNIKINMKLTLKQLQEIAIDHKISIKGNTKLKNKQQLYDDLIKGLFNL